MYEFYQQIEHNYKSLDPKGARWIEITDDAGWARFLLNNDFEMFLSERRMGYKLPVGSGDKSCTLSNWAENEGFQHDIKGFIDSMKAGEEYQMKGELWGPEAFLLVNFMEAVEKAEDNHKEDARKKGLVFPHPNWAPAGYEGYFVGCPFFNGLSAPMIRAGNHFFKTNKKSLDNS